jgi:hypothetical protein
VSDVLRAALALGALTSCAYLLMRLARSRGITGTDVVEAVGLAVMPSFVPGAIAMIIKAFGRPELPIFIYCNVTAFRQAWTDKRRP